MTLSLGFDGHVSCLRAVDLSRNVALATPLSDGRMIKDDRLQFRIVDELGKYFCPPVLMAHGSWRWAIPPLSDQHSFVCYPSIETDVCCKEEARRWLSPNEREALDATRPVTPSIARPRYTDSQRVPSKSLCSPSLDTIISFEVALTSALHE